MNWYQQHKKAAWFGLGAAAAMLLAASLVYVAPLRDSGSQAKAEGNGSNATEASRVKVVEPKSGGVERLVRRPATVQAFDFANLYAKVSGYLTKQQVDIGSKVKEGELLAVISAPELDKNVEKADADWKKSQAAAKAVEARGHKAQADLEAAKSQFARTEADVRKAKALVALRQKIYDRFQKLAAEDSIQQELVDEKLEAKIVAVEQQNAAEKAVDAAKSAVAAAGAAVKQTEADLDDAKASINVAKAALDRAHVWAKYMEITSPYTGVVTVRNFHNEDFIRDASEGGQLPMLRVARTDKMRVIVQVPDIDVPYLEVGAPANLRVGTLPDDHFPGKVARMAYQEAYDTRTMRTEVDLQNPDGLLKDGMYGEITIQLGREKGLRIPSKCLTGNERDGDVRSVFVVRDGRVHEVKVKIGRDDGIEVTIREGLSASDQVVVERSPGLADGSTVEIVRDRSENADKQEKRK